MCVYIHTEKFAMGKSRYDKSLGKGLFSKWNLGKWLSIFFKNEIRFNSYYSKYHLQIDSDLKFKRKKINFNRENS